VSNRTLAIAVTLALLASALAWLTRPSPTRGYEPTNEPASVPLGLDPASITRIEVDAAGVRAAVERGDGWTITLPNADTDAAPARWPADPDAVRAMLSSLTSLRVRPDEASNPEPAPKTDPADNDRPTTTIRVTSGDRAHTIGLTGPPLAGRLPVAVTTPDQSFTGTVPADRLRPASVAELAALAQPHPLRGPGVITAVDITTENTRIALQRDAGLWRLDEARFPMSPRLDQDAVADLLDSLNAVRMASVAVPFEPAGEPASITINLTTTLPRAPGEPTRRTTNTLRVLDQANIKGDANAVVTRTTADGQPLACRMTLNAQTFPSLPDSTDALLDPVPLPWAATETGTLRLAEKSLRSDRETPGQERVYQRTIEGWRSTDPDHALFDRTALETVLTVLASPHTPRDHTGDRMNRDTPERQLTLTAEPIGVGEPFDVIVMDFQDSIVIQHDQRNTVWHVEDGARVLRDAISRLIGEAP